MSDRKIEYSKLSTRVIGTRLKDGADEAVRYSYDVDISSDLLRETHKEFKRTKQFVAKVETSRGKKYQEVAIEKVLEKKEKGKTFFHFSLAYIRRERDDIRTKNLSQSYKTRTIKLGDGEFQFLPLHLTIEPISGTILLDAKCHTGPTETFLHSLFLPRLKPSDYGLTSVAQLDEKLRVTIKPSLRDDYDKVLKTKFRAIEEMRLTVAKPTVAQQNLTTEVDVSQKSANKRVLKAVGNLVSSIFGGNPDIDRLEDLPFRRLKLSFSFEDLQKAPDAAKYKKMLKEHSAQFVESQYVRESLLTYKDDEEHGLQKALLRGAVISKTNKLDPKHHNNNEKMWAEQRRIYFEVVEAAE